METFTEKELSELRKLANEFDAELTQEEMGGGPNNHYIGGYLWAQTRTYEGALRQWELTSTSVGKNQYATKEKVAAWMMGFVDGLGDQGMTFEEWEDEAKRRERT